MNKTSIEWTDYTWNPVTGCTKVSQGCKNCYAETLTKRFGKSWGVENFRQVVTHTDRLAEPYEMGHKLDGKRIFVCDMSDLFHEDVPFEFIDRVYQVIADLSNFKRIRSTWQILTKRPDRMLEYHQQSPFRVPPYADILHGVSVEDQATADQRIPILLQIAGTKFLSCEPLLGPIDLAKYYNPISGEWVSLNHNTETCIHGAIHWVIAGGESGHGARPMHPAWVRSLRNQCAAAGVPFFFKQWGEYIPFEELGFSSVPDEYYYCPAGEFKVPKNVTCEDCVIYAKVGKSISGNFLDGKQHLEFPITKPVTA